MRRCPTLGSVRLTIVLAGAASFGLGAVPREAAAQYANPVINGFEIAPAGSLEWELIDRLASQRRYEPRDLPWLARMTVLESIAMYQSVRSDLPDSLIGARIEGEMSILWDSAQLFYLSASYGDATSLVRAAPLLADVEAAYLQLNQSLGTMPAVSQLAAFHLRDIARMLPVMDDLVDAMETDQGLARIPAPGPRVIDLLREQSGRLLEELGGLVESLRQTNPAPARRDRLIAELEGLLDLAQGFDRLLATRTSPRELVESVRTLRSRVWSIEPQFAEWVREPRQAARWRSIRRQVDALSDRLGVARVIAPKTSARPVGQVDRRLLAQADRAIAAVDAMLAVPATAPLSGSLGLRYQRELEAWRRRIVEFRQQVASGQSTEVLTRSLREVEDLTRRLGERSRSESRIFRGGSRLDPRGLEGPSQAVEKLRALLPKSVASPEARVPAT